MSSHININIKTTYNNYPRQGLGNWVLAKLPYKNPGVRGDYKSDFSVKLGQLPLY